LDLSKLELMDSSGLQLLLKRVKHARENGSISRSSEKYPPPSNG
jgi:anti-anti-sigma regulatory factor